MELKRSKLLEKNVEATHRVLRVEERLRQARQLAVAVPEALEGSPVPHQVLVGFGLMIEGLLAEEET